MLNKLNFIILASLDSTAQTENANGVDWQEEAFQKVIFSF